MTGRNTAQRDRDRNAIRRERPPCGICGGDIDYALPYLDPMSYVVDHVVPVVKGGPDELANKQAAHRRPILQLSEVRQGPNDPEVLRNPPILVSDPATAVTVRGHGRTVEEFDMHNASACSLPNCGKPIKRRGYCYGHYMKTWRYGTPTPEFDPKWVNIVGRRFGTLTVVERGDGGWVCRCDCGRARTATAGELNRTGDAASCGDRRTHRRTEQAGYTAAHQRCRTDRGRVQEHDCVDCGQPAQHWSYNHDDPDERVAHGISANPVAYSLDPAHYSARCVPCHKRFDLGRRDSVAVV